MYEHIPIPADRSTETEQAAYNSDVQVTNFLPEQYCDNMLLIQSTTTDPFIPSDRCGSQ